ncbi:MAG: AsmA family protein [Nitrosomonas sp.]|nr:AsmA family protein [Nitrosomonas sp.]MDP1950102.1 AsmA family protein [Nitrosomonas sp.]
MNPFWKISLITLAVFILLLAGVMGYLVALTDQNTYKPLISQWVKEKTQRELTFSGDIKLTFSPRFGIHLNHLSLSEFQSDKEFARVERVFLSLSLQPLVNKQLVIHEITLHGLTGTVIRFADGRLNIDDLLATGEESLPFEFYIDQVRVEQAALTFHDALHEQQVAWSDLNLEIGQITKESVDNLMLTSKGHATNFAKNDAYNFVVRLDVPNLQFGLGHIASGEVSLITKVTQQQNRLNGKFTLSNLTRSGDHFASDLMAIELVTEKEAQIARIHLSSPVVVNLKTRQVNLPDITTLLSLSTPDFPDHPRSGILQGNFAAEGLAKHIQVNLAGNIEDSQIKVEFNMLGFEKPAFNVAIDIDQLNMDRWLPKSHEKTRQASPTENKQALKAQLNDRFGFSVLTDLNANGSIRIGSLRSGDLTLSGIRFEFLSDASPFNR